MKEKELYQPLKKFLVQHWNITENNIFAEVMNTDILILDGPANIILEMKTSLNFKVIEQAFRDIKYAHYVYIVIPIPKTRSSSEKYWFVYYNILREKKIGLIYYYVSEVNGKSKYHFQFEYLARFNRIPLTNRDRIRKHIKDYSNQNIAGSKSGETVTDYSITMDRVKKYLKELDDWVSIDDILKHCETHYVNPKPSLAATLVKSWNKDWCESKVINRKRYYRYLKKEEGASKKNEKSK